MDKPLISIVIPVYNTEQTIRRCIDSIIKQSYKNIEIIIVDDGSTDSSLSICNEYSNKHNNILVYHKTNGGVGSARQFGIDKANGIYIIHADPDDWVNSEWIMKLYETAIKTNADVTICNFIKVKSNKENNQEEVCIPQITNNMECLKSFLYDKITGQLWNKLIKRELLLKHDIKITEGLDLREDSSIMYRILYYANSIAIVNTPLYYYKTDNPTSYVNNLIKKEYQKDLYLLIEEMDSFIEKEEISDSKLLSAFKYQKFKTLGHLILFGDFDLIKKNRNLFQNISLKDFRLCPYLFYKIPFFLIYINCISIIPLYRILYNFYVKYLKNKIK